MDPRVAVTFDLIRLEAERFDEAVGRFEAAENRTRQLDALTAALDAAFGAFELAATLRSTDPDRAREVCDSWREVVLGVHAQECSIYQAATAGSRP